MNTSTCRSVFTYFEPILIEISVPQLWWQFSTHYSKLCHVATLWTVSTIYLHSCFNLHVCRQWRPVVLLSHFQFLLLYHNMSPLHRYMVCVKREKYAFFVTLRTLWSMKPGRAELCTVRYFARRRQITFINTHLSISSSSQLCALAQLGCIREAGTSL